MRNGLWTAFDLAEQAGTMPAAPAKLTSGGLAWYWGRLVRDVLFVDTPEERRLVKRYEAALDYLRSRSDRS